MSKEKITWDFKKIELHYAYIHKIATEYEKDLQEAPYTTNREKVMVINCCIEEDKETSLMLYSFFSSNTNFIPEGIGLTFPNLDLK